MRPSPSCCALTSYWTRRNSRIRKPGISLTAMSNHRTEGEGRMIGDNRDSRNFRCCTTCGAGRCHGCVNAIFDNYNEKAGSLMSQQATVAACRYSARMLFCV